MILTEFNSDRFFLGKLCKHQHKWKNTEQSLRHKNTSKVCAKCRQLSSAKYHKDHYQPRSGHADGDITYLGQPCKNNHLVNGQYSLRYTVGKQCIQCISDRTKTPEQKQKKREYYQQNIEKQRELSRQSKRRRKGSISEQGKIYYQKNREQILAKVNDYQQKNIQTIRIKRRKYYEQNRELFAFKQRLARLNPAFKERRRKYNKKYRLRHGTRINTETRIRQNSEEYRQYQRKYRKKYTATERGRLIVLLGAHRHHARKASNHSSNYTPEQVTSHLQKFNNRCAYCGSNEEKVTLDHLIPVSKHGPDVISNLVACCQSCNSSKNNRDAKEWYTSRPYYSRSRWQKILKILGKTEATLAQLPLF